MMTLRGRSTEQNLPQGGNWAALEEGAMEASISQVLCCTQLTLASLNREAIYKGYQVAGSLTESWKTRSRG